MADERAIEPLLDVVDLRTCFWTEEGPVRAVDGVSFSVAEGQRIGIVGESGSGKSAMAASILRLIDPPGGEILCGQILYRGRDLVALTENQMVAFLATAVSAAIIMAIGITYVREEINNFAGLSIGDFLAYFSILTHTDALVRGIFDLRDIIYFASMTVLLIFLNYIAVESRKY